MTLNDLYSIIRKTKLWIFDSDGCLMEEGIPYEYTSRLISKIKDMGKSLIIFTNNSTMHPNDLKKLYHEKNIHVDDVVSSGYLTVEYCKQNNISNVFIIGEKGLEKICKENGINIVDSNADAVIVGMDRDLTYKKLTKAVHNIVNGAKFIATNPDKSFPTPRGIEPGAGSMIAAVSAVIDRDPDIIIGKPNQWGYEFILQKFQIGNLEAIMVGDRYETDIEGAMKVNIPSILLKTGISKDRFKDPLYTVPKDIFVLDDLKSIYNYLQKE